jgi:YesN/AraC family two-component response regulator
VLLTDVNLPGMSGVELARRVFADDAFTKIIIAPGYGNFAKDEFEFKTAYLPKPFNIDSLRKVLSEVGSGAHCASETKSD